MRRKKLVIGLIVLVLAFALAACEQQGPMESAGEKADEAIEETREKMEEAGEAVEEKAEELTEEAKKATD